MQFRNALVCLVSLVVLSGCGEGPEDVRGAPKSPPTMGGELTPETLSSAEDSVYDLADRETFLATGPDCDELQNWYEQFPADTDDVTALRYIEECQEAPQPVLNGAIFPGSSDRMMRALLSSEVMGPSRAAAHEALAKGVCNLSRSGSIPLHLVGETVKDFGGMPDDYAAVVDASIRQCPSAKADLTVFTTRDVLSATVKFKKALRDAGADLAIAADDESIAALAAVICISLRDGEPMSTASLLLTSLFASDSEASRLGAFSASLYCPSYA